MKITRASTAVILTILIASLSLISLASAAVTSNFSITGTIKQIPIDLPSGTIFNSTITTTGTVRVWASDANGSLVANLGLVDNQGQLNFVAVKGGVYTISFENNLLSTVQVTFSYQTNPDISGGNNSVLPISYLPVFIIVTVVGCVLIIYFGRRNRRKVKHEINK